MLFYGLLHIDEKCKSFDCKDLKTGGRYMVDFMDNLLIFVCGFYVAMKHCIRGILDSNSWISGQVRIFG